MNTININVKSRDDYQDYQDDEYNQFNFFRFEFNSELQSIFISIQFQNFVSQQFQFQSYFQNRVYYSQQYNQQQQQSSSQLNQFSNDQSQQSILFSSAQRKQIIDSTNQNVQSNALNFNQRSYRQYNNRQRFVDKVFHVVTKEKNISKTNENSSVDYYDDDDYYDDTSNDDDIDENTNDSTTKNNFMIFFLKISIVQRVCTHCKTKFLFNNKLHRHLRQRVYQSNSFIDSFVKIFRQKFIESITYSEFAEVVKIFHQSIEKTILNFVAETSAEIIIFFASTNTDFDYEFRK